MTRPDDDEPVIEGEQQPDDHEDRVLHPPDGGEPRGDINGRRNDGA
jgi:hypothetical protein